MATSQFNIKTAEQYRDDFLRSVKNALITQSGIENPNVSYGTDHYIYGTAIGKIAELAGLNILAAADAQMADTATGEDLYRIGRIYNLSLKPAGTSVGSIVLRSSQDALGITSGQQLIDPQGLRYQVNIGGIFDNGDSIKIVSIDTGTGTNLAAGTVLRWVSPPAFVSPTALVATGGLTGGVDAETDEGLRTRILNRIRYPIGGGNWVQFADIAEKSSVSVQKAFVFPAFNGPSTVQVCVVRNVTATNKDRDVDTTIISTDINPALQAEVFEGIELLTTTPTNIPTNVSIGLSLPAATSATPAGPGGGWLDGEPFPVYDADGYAQVYSVTSTTVFTVYSDVAPQAGVSRFVFVNPDNFKIYHTKVLSYVAGPVSNTYTVTVDTPCIGIAVGTWVFPDALNADTYIAALLEIFAQLGPGQITNLASLLPFAYRRPYVSDSFPSDIGPSILKFIVNAGDEIQDVQYLYRSGTSPAIPSSVMDGPNILVPQLIGFYPI